MRLIKIIIKNVLESVRITLHKMFIYSKSFYLTLFIIFVTFNLYSQTWYTDTVDITGDLKLPLLAVNSQNFPGIVYSDYDSKKLKYATNINGIWITEYIMSQDPLYNYGHDFTFDLEDNPSVICIKTDRSDLYYVQNDGSAWTGTTVEAVERCDRTAEVSIDFDPLTGYSAFAYMGVLGGGVKCAQHNGTLWELEILDSSKYACRYNELKFDGNGNLFIVYADSRNDTILKCAYKANDNWQIDIVDNVGIQPSLAIDNNNIPWIAYIKPDYRLMLANKNNGEWVTAQIDIAAYHPVLKINPTTNLPAIVYEDYSEGFSNGRIILNEFNGVEWEGTEILKKAVHPGFDFTNDGYPAVCGIYQNTLVYSTTLITDQNENYHSMPNEFVLYQNYPNPFNPSTVIQYQIPVVNAGTENIPSVQLIIFDILGRELVTLVNEKQKPGNYEVEWNALNQSSGIYFYQINVGEFLQTKKMLLLK